MGNNYKRAEEGRRQNQKLNLTAAGEGGNVKQKMKAK